MKTQIKNPVLILLATLVVLAATLACSLTGSLNTGKDLNVNVSLKESDINRLLENSAARIDSKDKLLKTIDRVSFKDGLIQVFGTYEKDGKTLDGSYDVSLSAENGQLKVAIVGVNIEGITLDSPQVTKINDELAKDLSEAASENQGKVEFTKVEVTDTAVNISVKVILKNQ